jgi:pimeloyl-ACP methyl ester carboxylesterase
MTAVLIGVVGVKATVLGGGLIYRASRQRRVSKVLEMDYPKRIVEQRFVRLGGIDQWIQIRGEDRDNPVLLVLHGGPGWSNAVFTPSLRTWEKHFTVVQWDQRGAGMTFGRNGKAGTGEMTFDRRVADAIELTDFLRSHLAQDKVVLLAESMGTLTGVPLAKRRPDLFSALVLTDLYVDVARNETLKYQMTMERVRAAGIAKALSALAAIGPDPARWDLKAWNISMQWAFKTNVPTPDLFLRVLLPLVVSSPIHTLRDLYHLFAGFRWSTAQMLGEFMAYDARRLGTEFDVPVLIVQGDRDVITLTSLAQEFCAEVKAPTKRMSLIEGAGHFAAFTHPEAFLAELLTVAPPSGIRSATRRSPGPQISGVTDRARNSVPSSQDPQEQSNVTDTHNPG